MTQRSLLLRLVLLWALVSSGDAAAQNLTGFVSPGELAEPHAKLEGLTRCLECHAAGGVSATKCMGCHEKVEQQVASFRGFHGRLGENCEGCHPDHRGREFEMIQIDTERFAHQRTGFKLEGAHDSLACEDCHEEEGTWSGIEQACGSCHEEIHGAKASKRDLLPRCESCHTVVDWKALPLPTSTFDHGDKEDADFHLVGAHQSVPCADCHEDLRFVPTQADKCTDCHDDPHHTPFSGTCESCHDVVEDWRVPGFHHDQTDYPLEGQHRDASCRGCHGKSTTAPLPFGACTDCHEDPHLQQFEPRTCDDCHTVEVASFALPGFDHDKTDYPLLGEHQDVDCVGCHGESPEARYVDLPAEDCVACHQEDDPHNGKFDPQTCSSCHSELGWGVEEFDHDLTDYPLRGAHEPLDCKACHEEDQWSGLSYGSCAECHRKGMPHKDEMSDASCQECHVVDTWESVSFDHGTTDFPLDGAHVQIACLDCHQEATFTTEKTTCEACHGPDEPARHFDGACEQCHTTSDWRELAATANIHDATGFLLRGSHSLLQCAECHDERSDTMNLPAMQNGECVSCHAADEPHRNLLGDRCDDCHNSYDWMNTRWRHSQVGWALRGNHRLAACDECHATGFVGTPRDCWRCHENQADPSLLPHRSAYFMDCETCHRPYDWAFTRYPH